MFGSWRQYLWTGDWQEINPEAAVSICHGKGGALQKGEALPTLTYGHKYLGHASSTGCWGALLKMGYGPLSPRRSWAWSHCPSTSRGASWGGSGICIKCTLDRSLRRCSRCVPPGGDSRKDPGHNSVTLSFRCILSPILPEELKDVSSFKSGFPSLDYPVPDKRRWMEGYTKSRGLIIFIIRPPCPHTYLTASCIALRFSTVFSIICRLFIHCCRIHLCCKSMSSRSISA